MIVIHCEHCQANYVVGYREMISLHNTSEGPVGYVRCPKGHLNINAIVPAFEGTEESVRVENSEHAACAECEETAIPARPRTSAA